MNGFSVSDILRFTGGRLVNEAVLGTARDAIRVERPVPLAGSRPSELAFFFSRAYEKEVPQADCGVLITGEPFVKPLEASGLPLWKSAAVIACADPYLALGILSEKFAERISSVAHLPGTVKSGEVHPTALVEPGAEIAPDAIIGPNCVVAAGAKIGPRTRLYPGCFVGPDAVIGADGVLFPGVTVYEWTRIGDRVRIHAGTVIGSDGFGYVPRRDGKTVTGHQKIYHLGRVVIGDDVEIGANCTLDRSTFGETRIDSQVKLDNLVHVGHNARVGEGTVIAGGTCLAGRAAIGRFAQVGGLTGITNDVLVGDGASVGALALITKDVPPGTVAVGNPQREYREHFKAHAQLNRLIAEKKSEKNKRHE